IMTGENARLVRQGQNFHDGAIKTTGTAARKVRPCRAGIRHEQRVMHEGGISDDIGDRSKRMPRREQDARWNAADGERVTLSEKPVPLRTVGAKFRPVVDSLPELLNLGHLLADCRWRSRDRF